MYINLIHKYYTPKYNGTESFSKDYTTHQSRLCTESMIATNGRFEALQTTFHIHHAIYTEILSTDAYIRAWQLRKNRRCGCDKGGAFSIVWEVSKASIAMILL